MARKLKDLQGIPLELRETLVMPAQADSTAVDVATLKNEFNSLLAKLRAVGLLDS
ncbi:MAG: hypothetical protein ABRQ25_08975 [Clostridiaceae bacterium]